MAYMMVEASIRTHPKFLAAGPEACWLWLCGLGYCQEGLTDGFIPDSAIEYLGVKRARRLAQRLVSVRLWETARGGWQMHDYLRHNKSAEQVRAIMHRRAAGGKLGGRPKKNLQGLGDGGSDENLQGLPSDTSIETLEGNLPENPDLPTTTDTTDLPSTEESPELKADPEPENGASPVALIFPTVGRTKAWGLTEEQIAIWTELYPGIDVLAQMRKALAWAGANPARRKTAKGMPRFCVNWLTRTTDNGHGAHQVSERPFTPHELEQAQAWRRAMGGCGHQPKCDSREDCIERFIHGRLRGQKVAS